MRFSRLLFLVAQLLAPIALLSTTWLYLYPVFNNSCVFPKPPATYGHPIAPFRLLALGDPQLEGDSSLPDPNAAIFPSLEYLVPHLQNAESNAARIDMLKAASSGALQDLGKWLEGKRKAIDLWGNDWYLAHIVRSLRWWTRPSHVAVLGDLLGSQWITEGEFERRAGRYWGIVMRGLENVPRWVFGKVEEEKTEEEVKEEKKVEKEENPKEGENKKEENEEEEKEEERGNDEQSNIEGNGDDVAKPEAEESEEGSVVESESKEDQVEERRELLDALNAAEEEKKQESMAESSSVENKVADAWEWEEIDQEHMNDDDHKEQEQETKISRKPSWGGTTEVLGADPAWESRVINIAGNHDVGYAGDLDDYRIERFEKAFGSVNWDIWFTLPEELRRNNASENSSPEISAEDTPPALRLVILNSMNLDTPAWNSDLQTETYEFMNHIITSSRSVDDKTHATILLTHIPLEKQPGVCVDSPYFDFFDGGHGVREQNMLSDFSSKTVLEGIFGMSSNMYAAGQGLGRRGIILNGHDHEGCDVTHFIRQDGVFDACEPTTMKKEDAHWPVVSSTSTTTTTETSTTTTTPTDININHETSPANPFLPSSAQETSPVPTQPPHQEDEDEEQDPDPSFGWRAHRFPHRPYSITHHALTNTTTCTSIARSPHIREITLRSMMGEFSGYAGFLSAWFDPSLGAKGEWVFAFATCGVGVQHWWWGVHIIDLVVVVCVFAGAVCLGFENWSGRQRTQKTDGGGGVRFKESNGKTTKI